MHCRSLSLLCRLSLVDVWFLKHVMTLWLVMMINLDLACFINSYHLPTYFIVWLFCLGFRCCSIWNMGATKLLYFHFVLGLFNYQIFWLNMFHFCCDLSQIPGGIMIRTSACVSSLTNTLRNLIIIDAHAWCPFIRNTQADTIQVLRDEAVYVRACLSIPLGKISGYSLHA